MDTKLQSLMRGRLGAALLAVGSGLCSVYGITGAEQQALYQSGSTILAASAAILAVVSKVREKK